MQAYINRKIEPEVKKNLMDFPVVAILGPRQCGKSTLAKRIISSRKKSLYLDLELESDLRKIEDPELFLSHHEDKLVCIDEIQRMPDLFKSLRGIIDRKRRNGRFMILGSASRDLIRQSSETLAGRICYLESHWESVTRQSGHISIYYHKRSCSDSCNPSTQMLEKE